MSNSAASIEGLPVHPGPSPAPLDVEPVTQKGLGVATGLYTREIKSSYVVLCLCLVTTVSKERARSS